MVERVDSWEHKYIRTVKMQDIEYNIEVCVSSDKPNLHIVLRRNVITPYRSRYIEQIEFYDLREAVEVLKEIEDVYRKVVKEIYGTENTEL